MAPDKPYVNLENYNSAISSIKAKGFIELRCQNMGLEINHKKPLFLNFVTPGMFQFFMILTFGNWDGKSGYLRIYEPEHLDARDYTETWFSYILPILGNMSQSISDKLVGNPTGELSGDFYMITNYKLVPVKEKKLKGFYKLRIYI